MEKITQLVQSYYNFRAAVLRSLTSKQLSRSEFSNITGLNCNSKYRRTSNPNLWKPVEIYQLGVNLGLSDGGASHLYSLAVSIKQLPADEKKRLMKASALTEEKLNERIQNRNSWLASELEKIYSLVRYQ